MHSAIDDNTRLAYAEAGDNETAATAIDFRSCARVSFAAHGISCIERVITGNGSCYRAADLTSSLREARHYRIKPYIAKHNEKTERYNRTLSEERLYSREYTSEQQRVLPLRCGTFTTITVSLGVADLELASRVGIVPLPRRGRDSYNCWCGLTLAKR
ncbi:transposase family protein [Rhodococcus sp. KBS0724]|nr:transposase family protein [Rhodococcus sp. KBS0724]